MTSFVVAKFGGTSVADYDAMNRSADVVLADPYTRLVVLSASAGVTNLLVSLSEGLEQHLLGLKEGDKTTFALEPDAAFGVSSPDLIQYFSRREFMDAGEPEIGAIMLFTAMDGSEMPGVIREINGDSITVDFNHPLAGHTVHFDIEVLEIDPALEE